LDEEEDTPSVTQILSFSGISVSPFTAKTLSLKEGVREEKERVIALDTSSR